MGAEPEAAFPVNHFCAFGSERCHVFPREVLERLRARVVPADVTDLCAAAAGGDAEKVRELLEAGGEVNAPDEFGSAALHRAIVQNRTEVVELLLNHPQIDARRVDDDGFAPIHLAAMHGHVECMRLLLADAALGVSVNDVDDNGRSPLYYAVMEEQFACAEWIASIGGKG